MAREHKIYNIEPRGLKKSIEGYIKTSRVFKRVFPIQNDVKYKATEYEPKAPYIAKFNSAVATNIVAKDGSGDFEDIQSAIDDLPASGGVVYIKEGEYRLKTAIIMKSYVSLIGAGYSTRIMSYELGSLISANEDDYVSVSHLRLSGPTATRGISFYDTNYCSVDNCWIDLFNGTAVHIGGTGRNNNKVANCFIIDAITGISLYSGYSLVSGNTIKNTTEDGLYIVNGKKNIVSNNLFINPGDSGIKLSAGASNTIITGNSIYSCSDHGIAINADCDRNIISNNQSLDTSSGYGVKIYANADKNIILGNVLYSNQAGAWFDGGAGTIIEHNIIS